MTTIEITNWDSYQNQATIEGNQRANEGQSEGNQAGFPPFINKEYKKRERKASAGVNGKETPQSLVGILQWLENSNEMEGF